LVSSLIRQHGALQHAAINAKDKYHADTTTVMSPEQDGQLAAQLPALLPALLGAIGGLAGGSVAAAAQLPQALMQGGQQPATGPLPHERHSPTRQFDHSSALTSPASGAPGTAGMTTPAGATSMVPQSTPPTPSLSVPRATAPSAQPSGAGPSAMPSGMPMGMPAHPSNTVGRQVPSDKTLVVPVVPNTESVTGRVATDRLAGAARDSAKIGSR
jgi:hypothetical protein